MNSLKNFDDKSFLGKEYVEIDFRDKFRMGVDKVWLILNIRNGSLISINFPGCYGRAS